ncbi:MAG TPA: enoyl-CoA hydratase/isomerase family protein [Aldersonia sp.]
MRQGICVEDHDGIAVARLAHGKVNALDIELCQAITTTMHANADADAIVLTGTGSVFSAGVDLHRLRNSEADYVAEFLPALDEAFLAVFETPRPVVAAINGHALAGGCLLAAACDLRLMSAGTIGVTELPVGLPFPLAGLEIMRHAFGPATNHLVITAAKLDPPTAHRRGIIDELTTATELLPRALARARTLGAIPHATYALTKKQLHRPVGHLIDHGKACGEHEQITAAWTSPTAHAAIDAYLDTLTTRRRTS